MNGGVLFGRPRAGRGCGAIYGWNSLIQLSVTVNILVTQANNLHNYDVYTSIQDGK
jgi:hypothetical protein